MPQHMHELIKLTRDGLPANVINRDQISNALVSELCKTVLTQQDLSDLGIVKVYRGRNQATSDKIPNIVVNLGKLLSAAPSAALTVAGSTHSVTLMVLAAICLLQQLHGLYHLNLAEDQAAIVTCLCYDNSISSSELYAKVKEKQDYPSGKEITMARFEKCLQDLEIMGIVRNDADIIKLVERVAVY
jgi:hypothetical protein